MLLEDRVHGRSVQAVVLVKIEWVLSLLNTSRRQHLQIKPRIFIAKAMNIDVDVNYVVKALIYRISRIQNLFRLKLRHVRRKLSSRWPCPSRRPTLFKHRLLLKLLILQSLSFFQILTYLISNRLESQVWKLDHGTCAYRLKFWFSNISFIQHTAFR